jgi:hypothetical protein
MTTESNHHSMQHGGRTTGFAFQAMPMPAAGSTADIRRGTIDDCKQKGFGVYEQGVRGQDCTCEHEQIVCTVANSDGLIQGDVVVLRRGEDG